MTTPALAYVGICQHCNRIIGACAVSLRTLDHALGQWAREGLLIEKRTTEQVKAAAWGHAQDCSDNTK